MNDTTPSASSDPAESDLIRGESLALRKWDREAPREWKPDHRQPYETVGYVIAGRAELRVAGKVRELNVGDAYHVPRDTDHSYRIVEEFTAVEATTTA